MIIDERYFNIEYKYFSRKRRENNKKRLFIDSIRTFNLNFHQTQMSSREREGEIMTDKESRREGKRHLRNKLKPGKQRIESEFF